MHQLGNHAPHGITHGDEPADVEGFCQRGDIVSAILEPEPRTQADPVAMSTQVGRDDPEITRERREDHPPVQLRRNRHPVDKHQRLGAAGTSTLPDRVVPRPGSSTRRVNGIATPQTSDAPGG